jgi:hypothetical protein
MMDIKELFSGIAIIIDDKINDDESGDKILQIRKKLKSEQIPFIEYEDIPSNEIIGNFSNVSFVLLDWELFDKPEPGMKIDEEIFIKNNIDFIKNIKETTFVPIFIFSYLDPDAIVRKLSEEGLYNDDSNNFIFVKKKDDLISKDDENKIFTEIEKWLNKTPSIYVLKEWEKALSKSKKELFWSFYDTNHYWPSVLQNSFIGDGSDVNYELGNFIFKNLMARIEPIEFDKEILKLEGNKISKEDIRKILEAERFIKNESLPSIPFTGDLYKRSQEGKKYLLNIRPECDIIRKDNPSLYCLDGIAIDEKLINSNREEDKKKKITFENNGFIEKSNKLYLPFIDEGKILEFTLNDITIKKWNDLKEKRIGRILPPYITRIQQKYAFYLQRQGLPAIPEKAIINV